MLESKHIKAWLFATAHHMVLKEYRRRSFEKDKCCLNDEMTGISCKVRNFEEDLIDCYIDKYITEIYEKLNEREKELFDLCSDGNMKTGDVWLEQGGTIIEPGSSISGKWAYYNFNTKTGEIKEITGKGKKEWFDAPHATIYADRMVVDEGGVMSRCPSKEHPPSIPPCPGSI